MYRRMLFAECVELSLYVYGGWKVFPYNIKLCHCLIAKNS